MNHKVKHNFTCKA